MDYFDGVHVIRTSSSMGPLDYKELFIRLAFSTTPSSDRYAMQVSVDMTACPWKFNYGDHHISPTATRDSHDAAPTHGMTSLDMDMDPLTWLSLPCPAFPSLTSGPAAFKVRMSLTHRPVH